MTGRGSLCVASVVAVLAAAPLAHGQQFSPHERDLLFQPSPIGGSGSFHRGTTASADAVTTSTQNVKPATTPRSAESKSATPSVRAKSAKSKPATPHAPASISAELSSGKPHSSSAPALRRSDVVAPGKPWDEKIPFGPLSLGVQADSGPRSNSLTTPGPSGMDQFKKDRFEPYVGVSIIDIKR